MHEEITYEQRSALSTLLCERGFVLKSVWYDHEHRSINFRTRLDPSTEFSCRLLDSNTESVRYAIMDDGTIVDRNSDRRFVGWR